MAALAPSHAHPRPADPLFVYADDGNSTALHYICAGQQTGPVTGFLLGWQGVRPAPADAARAELLAALLRDRPAALPLACYVNSQGSTPVHLAVLSASGRVLATLVGAARRALGRRRAALLLCVPDAKGRSPLDLAIASQQWEAAALLADTARLSHTGAVVAAQAACASASFRRAAAPGSPSAGTAIAGAVGGAINRLWDTLGGDRAESQSVAAHRQQGVLQGAEVDVAVLGNLEAVQARRQRQIDAVAAAAGAGAPGAEACLAKCGWNKAAAAEEAVKLQQIMAGATAEGKTCLVCFEECGSGEGADGVAAAAARLLPCGHLTCDACLAGVFEAAAPQGACCPEPSCRLPLPLAAARAALPPAKFQRAARLAAEAYVQVTPALRWCPAPGCSRCLEMRPAGAAVASGAGLDAACACGAACCWSCGEAAHEPASCAQARAWGDELQTLRAAAPAWDEKWLRAHARRCPGCATPTQRTGGCNHMTCVACGKHWCWECGRDWREHSADTGGFYFCSLDTEAAAGGGEGGGGASRGEDRGGGWLRQVWASVAGVASQATLNRALQMHLRHDVDAGVVAAVATHLHRLAERLGLGGSGDGDGAAAGPPGPQEVGFSAADVARMEPQEWVACLAAACRSAADAGGFGPASPAPSPPSSPKNAGQAGVGALDAPALAAAVAEAHAALHHAAAVLRALPGGARRRYFQELCDGAERRLAAVEPLLMGAPFQAEAAAAGAVPDLGSDGGGGPLAGLRGALSALLQRWRGVAAPPAEGRLPGGVPAQVVVAQAHYVMHTLGREGARAAEGVEALRRATAALKHAARRGLFA